MYGESEVYHFNYNFLESSDSNQQLEV